MFPMFVPVDPATLMLNGSLMLIVEPDDDNVSPEPVMLPRAPPRFDTVMSPLASVVMAAPSKLICVSAVMVCCVESSALSLHPWSLRLRKFESNSALVSPDPFGIESVVTDDVDSDLVTSLAFGIGDLR